MAEMNQDTEYIRGMSIHTVGTSLFIKTGGWRVMSPFFEDKVPPCQNACPAGNDIEAWIKLIQRGRLEDAYWHVKREEPFPAILGRVCVKFCEGKCNRAALDSSVSIKALECFVGDSVDPTSAHPQMANWNGKSVAVVGSGPSGMSAAYFARLMGFKVTLLEARAEVGGSLLVGVNAKRLPRDVLAREFEGLKSMGIEVKTNTEVGKDITLKQLEDQFDYIYVATGAELRKAVLKKWEGKSPLGVGDLLMLKKIVLAAKPDGGKKTPVIQAVAEGKMAAIVIDFDLKDKNGDEELSRIAIGDGGAVSFSLHMGWKNLSGIPFDNKTVVTTEKIKYDYLEKLPRAKAEGTEAAGKDQDSEQYDVTYSKEEALEEAARCIHCGRCMECDKCRIFCPDASVMPAKEGGGFAYEINYDYCKGCLVCVEECPCGVISSSREEE